MVLYLQRLVFIYCNINLFLKVFIFGHFEEVLFCKIKFLRSPFLQNHILTNTHLIKFSCVVDLIVDAFASALMALHRYFNLV